MHESNCPRGKTRQIFNTFFLFSSVFPRTVDVAPDVGFQWSWSPWKACDTFFLKVLDLQKVELGSRRYGSANRGHRRVFPCWRAVFRLRFWPSRGRSWRFESCMLCLNVVLKVPDLRINLQWVGKNLCVKATSPGENYEIFSIISFLSSIFLCLVDIAPDVRFWQTWYPWKAWATFFLKVSDLQEGELEFERYGPTNEGCRSAFSRRGVIFRSRFRLDRGSSWRSESCML